MSEKERRIRVTLTLAEWRALHSCTAGEAENIANDEHQRKYLEELESALRALERGRKGRST